MQKIINGLLYDTEKAKIICKYKGIFFYRGYWEDREEILYETSKKNYFIFIISNPILDDKNAPSPLSIREVSLNGAKSFVAEHGTIEIYRKHFPIKTA